jgi:hypothetical protein
MPEQPVIRVSSAGAVGDAKVYFGEHDISHLVQRIFWEADRCGMTPSLTICLLPGAAAELATTQAQFVAHLEDLPL